MSTKSLFADYKTELDEEIPSSILDIFRRKKIQCRIIYEDGSYHDFYKKFSKSYSITIKKRHYFVNPRCIMRGKKPSITWFFNNPMPINFDYQPSKLTAKELIEPAKLKKLTDEEKEILANIKIDSEGMQSLFNTRLMQGLYANKGLTMKGMILILVVVFVIVLVILQLTGQVDIMGMLTGK